MASNNELNLIISTKLNKEGFVKDAEDLIKIAQKYGQKIERFVSGKNKRLPKNVKHNEKTNEYSSFHQFGKDVYKAVHVIKDNKAQLTNFGRTSWENAGTIFGLDVPKAKIQSEVIRAQKQQQKELQKVKKEQEKEAKKLAKEEAKSNKEAKKPLSWIQKFWNTFKRIGIYRLIRGFFATIKNAFVQGIQTLAQFDKSANKTMSSIVSSAEKLKASMSLAFMPFLESLSPAIESVAQTVANVANEISRASSASKGMSEYTAISDKYMKNYADTLNGMLASFDKFSTISGKTNPYEKRKMSPEEMAEAESSTAYNVLNSVKGIISIVWEVIKSIGKAIAEVWQAIEPHMDKITRFIEKLIEVGKKLTIWALDLIVKIVDFLEKGNNLEITIWAIIGALLVVKSIQIANWFIDFGSSIVKCVDNLKSFVHYLKTTESGMKALQSIKMGGTFIAVFGAFYMFLDQLEGKERQIMSIITALFGLAIAIVSVKSAMKGNWFGLVAGIAMATAGIVAGITGLQQIKYMEDGGVIPRAGSLFVAGENGAEFVHKMPSGATGVTNVSQFKQAMREALYESADLFQQEQATVVLNLDGAEIARSKRFTNEINRKNSGIHLR